MFVILNRLEGRMKKRHRHWIGQGNNGYNITSCFDLVPQCGKDPNNTTAHVQALPLVGTNSPLLHAFVRFKE